MGHVTCWPKTVKVIFLSLVSSRYQNGRIFNDNFVNDEDADEFSARTWLPRAHYSDQNISRFVSTVR